MSQISALVTEIFEGTIQQGRSKGKKFWSITLEPDTRLTCFDAAFIKDVRQGEEFMFPIEARGDYVNIVGKAIAVISLPGSSYTEAPDSTTEAEPPLPNVTVRQGDERGYKNRISALQAAVTFIAGALGGTATEKDVIETATRFEEYLKTGE